MRTIARFLRRLADQLDPAAPHRAPQPAQVVLTAINGRDIERAINRHRRETGRRCL